ncbi:hypothetical protein IWQ61_007101 [Dispira simplex]|nr:hypothetical protein IWQ61_007101 [Dispira simplex]
MDHLPKLEKVSVMRDRVGEDVTELREWTNRLESRDLARQLVNMTRFQMFYFGTVKRQHTKQGGVIRGDGEIAPYPDDFHYSDEELEDDDMGIVPVLESELYPNSKILSRPICLGKRKREESVRELLGYTVRDDPATDYNHVLQIGSKLRKGCPELYFDNIFKLRRVLDGTSRPADRIIKDCPEPQFLGLYDIRASFHELIHRTWCRRTHRLLSPINSTVLMKRDPDDQETKSSSTAVNNVPKLPGDLCTLTKKELGASLQGVLTHLHLLKHPDSLTENNPKATTVDKLDWRDVLLAGKAYGIPAPVLKRCYLRMAHLTPDNAFTIKEFIRRGPVNDRNELLVNPIDNF